MTYRAAWVDAASDMRKDAREQKARGRIKLAGKPQPKPAKLLRGERRAHAVDSVMDRLRDWRLSPFEYEGECRHALRSGFCLGGVAWWRADFEAAEIVAEGLRLLGAQRPSWEQGQREAVDVSAFCFTCGSAMGSARDRRNERFCSPGCAARAMAAGRLTDKPGPDRIRQAAWRLLRRQEVEERPCKHCSAPFRPKPYVRQDQGKGFYCSPECYAASRWINPMQPCEHCSKPFQPAGGPRPPKFCSRECWDAGRSFVCRCAICGVSFTSKQRAAIYCCEAHAKLGNFVKVKARANVIVLTPVAFDREFSIAA